jgi:hypothetical protein
MAREGRNESEGDAMTDTTSRRSIRVSTDGSSGPYIMISVELLEKVQDLLDAAA